MSDYMIFLLCLTIAACGCLIYTAIHRLIDAVNDLADKLKEGKNYNDRRNNKM